MKTSNKKNMLPFERRPVQISLLGLFGTGMSLLYNKPKTSVIFLGVFWGGAVCDSVIEKNTDLGKFLNNKFFKS